MNQKALFYYECMDTMLNYLTSKPKAELYNPPDIAKACGLNLENEIAHLLCAKMETEGHLEGFPDAKYSLKAESIFFVAEGGYIGKLNRDAAENARIKSNERAILLLTVVLALGTAPVGILALTDLYWKYKWFRSDFWWTVVVVTILLSGLTSYIVYKLLDRKRRRKQTQ